MSCQRISLGVVRTVVVFCLLAFAGIASADVKLPAVIGDNMVVQQDIEVSVWGWADPGEEVTVSLGDSSATATADADGDWNVRIGPFSAGGPHGMTVKGNNVIELNNVLVGEVWVCSGQSNMQWAVNQSANARQEIADANYPRIRLFSVDRTVAAEPMKDCGGRWLVCTPQTVPGFSAVGYYFGRELHNKLEVPVGLIHTSWGGTPAEAWTSRDFLEMNSDFAGILERYAKALEVYPKAKAKYESELRKFEETAARLKAEGKVVPRRPRALREPMGPQHPHAPAGLFNGMIAPLIPYAIRGAIWYQGEANADRAYQYRELFPTMIYSWRQKWGQGDFPFLYVQLANFMERADEPGESAWAELREAQLMTLSLPRTGMATIIDIGEAENIHPKNKQDVGRRLARWAFNDTYGMDVVPSGPIFAAMDIREGKAILHFRYTGDGLVAGDGALTGFAIAGIDRDFVWAEAGIVGDTVVVHSPEVRRPVAVRYGWANNPECNLYNEEGLPASPFRTDIWPGVTADRK